MSLTALPTSILEQDFRLARLSVGQNRGTQLDAVLSSNRDPRILLFSKPSAPAHISAMPTLEPQCFLRRQERDGKVLGQVPLLELIITPLAFVDRIDEHNKTGAPHWAETRQARGRRPGKETEWSLPKP